MRIVQKSLDIIANMMTGSYAEPFYEFNKLATPLNVPRDTVTELNVLDIPTLAAGTYEVVFQEYISYDTTRGKYTLSVASTTHTITIPSIVHEPKDSHEVNPENQRFIFDHAGGAFNFNVSVEHATDNTLTVHYADLSIERKK